MQVYEEDFVDEEEEVAVNEKQEAHWYDEIGKMIGKQEQPKVLSKEAKKELLDKKKRDGQSIQEFNQYEESQQFID